MHYVVGVEFLPYPETERTITVTDGPDGFGPDLLSGPDPEVIEADCPATAGIEYAAKHKLFPIRCYVNLKDTAEELWLTKNGVAQSRDRLLVLTVPLDNNGTVESLNALAHALVKLMSKCHFTNDEITLAAHWARDYTELGRPCPTTLE